jgi:hypothetical protein
MSAPKGSKNARRYQEDLIFKNKNSVELELKRLRELRAEFGSFTALSKAIAKATGLTDVTLRRNRVYRALLLNYINVQSTRSSSNSRGDAELNKLRHKITELETQLSNASADNV